MTQRHKIQLFEDKKVRTAWDDEREEWYFSIVDVCGVLSESENPQTYWRVLKNRLKKEGNETVTNCNALKMLAPDGKMRLTDEWDRAGVQQGQQYASLTDIITREWSGKTTRQYKQFKGLKKESLRDNMTNTELILNMLAESAATDLSKEQNPQGYKQSVTVAKKGGSVAKAARDKLESQLGHSVISPAKAADYLPPAEDVQALPEGDTDG